MFSSGSPRLVTGITLLMVAALAAACTSSPPSPAVPTKATAPAAVPPTSAPVQALAPTSPATLSPAIAPTSAPTKAAATAAPAVSPALTLEWFGQSTFLLSTSRGTRLLMDPAATSTGYTIQPMSSVDAVTVSHEHSDHNNVGLASGSPTVIRGLKDGDWAKVDQTVKDVKMRTIATYHDDQNGAQRGKNAVFLLEVDGLRIAHLGDLGHLLSPEQVTAIGPVEVSLIPVGGFYTVDAAMATRVLGQLSPRVVVPMHYRTAKVPQQSPLGPVDPFLEGKKVERSGGNKVSLSRDKLPDGVTVYLLGYEP